MLTRVHGPNEAENYILRSKGKLRSRLIQSPHCADKKIELGKHNDWPKAIWL